MSEITGKLIICDKCGRKEFLRHKDMATVGNDFFTCGDYEVRSPGWDYVGMPDMPQILLCPSCCNDLSEQFKIFLDTLDPQATMKAVIEKQLSDIRRDQHELEANTGV